MAVYTIKTYAGNLSMFMFKTSAGNLSHEKLERPFYMLTLRVVSARVHVVLNGSFTSPVK